MIFDSLHQLQPQDKDQIVVILQSIWTNRNQKIWDNVYTPSATVISLAMQFWHEWLCCKISCHCLSHDYSTQVWQPPNFDVIKCNLDATIFKDHNCFDISMCLQDDHGNFIRARTIFFDDLPQQAEAKVFLSIKALFELNNSI